MWVHFKSLTIDQKNIVFEYDLKKEFGLVKYGPDGTCLVIFYFFILKRILFQIEGELSFDTTMYAGFYFDDIFGLVSDSKNDLKSLPYVPDSNLFKVFLRDRGDNAFVRFEIAEVPEVTRRRISNAEQYMVFSIFFNSFVNLEQL